MFEIFDAWIRRDAGNIFVQAFDTALGLWMGLPSAVCVSADKEEKLTRQCRECDVLFACGGGCPKHRFLNTPDGAPGLNCLCAGYRKFFHHIDPSMRAMAQLLKAGRPAADIMTVPPPRT